MRNLDILAAENGEHVRVLLCGEEQSYVVSCQHFQMPYPVASDLLAELQPVPAETYSVLCWTKTSPTASARGGIASST